MSKVESLRVGLMDKATTAARLSGTAIHMPPKEALEVVGVEAPDYDGDDIALLSGTATTLEQTLAPPPPPPPALLPPGAPPVKPQPGTSPAKPGDDPGTPAGSGNELPKALVLLAKRRRRGDRWSQLVRAVQRPYEAKFMTSWRSFIAEEKRRQLYEFDANVKRGLWQKAEDDLLGRLGDVFLDLATVKGRLKDKFRKLYESELHATYDFTVKEIGGIAVFELDSPEIVAALDRREDLVVGSVPETLQNNLRVSLRKGLQEGETVQQLRTRVARTYDIAASSGKTLQVARTESAGFMNDARQAMFEAQGFEKVEWLTAGDEYVREHHVTFGSIGPVDMGHNYMEDVDDDGTLEYPNDPRGPAGEVVNCRCVHVPA
jgi:hypothetical protein